jgi:hypothetical protein
MIRVTWDEFVKAGSQCIAAKFPDHTLVLPPQFKKDYGSYDGGIGDAYDLPGFVDFEIAE